MSWQTDLLQKLGYPTSQQNIDFLTEWAQYEGVSSSANNWLATTQTGPGCTPTYNSAGVVECASIADGVNVIAETLQNGYYPNILAALKSGSPYDYGNMGGLVSNINTWGTHGFANVLSKGAGYTPPSSPNSAPSWQSALGAIEGDIGNAVNTAEQIAGGIFNGVGSFFSNLFGGWVSPFLRLPQSLINIGWNFGGFCVGLFLIAVGGLLLFGSIFEDAFATIADKLDDMNQNQSNAIANAAAVRNAAPAPVASEAVEAAAL